MSTIEELKDDRDDLQDKINRLILDFQEKHGVYVDEIVLNPPREGMGSANHYYEVEEVRVILE